MVICPEQGADLHMAQLMPLPLTFSCFSKIQIGFTVLVPAYPGSPGKGPLNGRTYEWGRPVRTKSRQNESLFRSNGTHVFVLLGFRSDGFSFYWAVAVRISDDDGGVFAVIRLQQSVHRRHSCRPAEQHQSAWTSLLALLSSCCLGIIGNQ